MISEVLSTEMNEGRVVPLAVAVYDIVVPVQYWRVKAVNGIIKLGYYSTYIYVPYTVVGVTVQATTWRTNVEVTVAKL